MLVILGGGFGLYGYLPAALSLPETQVALPERYRATIRSRAELRSFEKRVHWVASERDALSIAERVIVARRPQDQLALSKRLSRYPNIRSLVLEKPLTPSPAAAAQLADGLRENAIPFRVGYTLARTPWAGRLEKWIAQPEADEVFVRWDFMANHYLNSHATWKRSTNAGGGALRFYGVQLLAAITRAERQTPKLLSSTITVDAQDTTRMWNGTLLMESGTVVHLQVDSHSSAPRFSVHAPGLQDINFSHPFGEVARIGDQDLRTSLLASILREDPAGSDYDWTQRVHELWLAAETEADVTSSVTTAFSIPTSSV